MEFTGFQIKRVYYSQVFKVTLKEVSWLKLSVESRSNNKELLTKHSNKTMIEKESENCEEKSRVIFYLLGFTQ